MQVRLRSKDELEAEARAFAATVFKATTDQPAVKVRNERAVLDLGNLTFFTFQGRAYGVPPIPYQVGVRLSRLSAELLTYGKGLTPDTIDRYRAIVASIPRACWRLAVPVGRLARFRHRLRLDRNPFLKASEADLGMLLSFFLTCRTKTSVRPLSAPSDLAPLIS